MKKCNFEGDGIGRKEWERPKPGHRPDIFPQFSPIKTPLPPPMPYDPPEEDEEEEEEDPEKEEGDNPEKIDISFIIQVLNPNIFTFMNNITDEKQEALQSSDIDRELLEFNEVIDLIKLNSIEHISELLQPINSNNTNNIGSNEGLNMSFEYQNLARQIGWKPGGIWEIEIKNLTDNHDGSNDMSGHPSHRRFLRDRFIRICDMTMSGIAPRQIITSLRQSNANLQSISRSIYNARAKLRKDNLQGRTVCIKNWAKVSLFMT
ncbi:hypothetical protein POM88_024328 [Heracleum sosnowskyi]|uniref:Uncharacterized protein n=1 Tax=Heracleum sosnowskyi TaxID=360622 RepID=A0AAD8MM71_9APIA|nr:hypothetical protein POM88_024328 [Heracleum sosnowskyi]